MRRMYSRTVPQGQTISQEQAEGTMLPPQSAVNFAVASLPALQGASRPRRNFPAARSAITKADCRVGKVKRVRSKKVKRGRVISQSPKAGKSLPNLGKVNLVVSRGRR